MNWRAQSQMKTNVREPKLWGVRLRALDYSLGFLGCMLLAVLESRTPFHQGGNAVHKFIYSSGKEITRRKRVPLSAKVRTAARAHMPTAIDMPL